MVCAPCLLAAILLANLILVSVFIFMRYPAGRGLHSESTRSIVAVNGT